MSAEIADRELLDQALAGLDPDHRAVVVLHYFLGMSVPEVARAIGIPSGTAKSRLHYAVATMRAGLFDEPTAAHVRGRRRAIGMTNDRRFDRDLPGLLTDLVAPSMPPYRDDIVRRTALTRQRPAWTFPERWLPVDLTTEHVSGAPIRWRPIAVAALVLIAIVAAALFAAGSRPPQPLPAPPFGPAANGLIVYATDGDLYLGDPTTDASRAIISGPEADFFPTFSRDGTKLFFLRIEHYRGPYLMVADADGSEPRAVTPEPFIAVSGTDWSGDGRYLLITSEVDHRQTMSVVDTATGEVRVLDVGMAVWGPTFRPPDGRQIAFTAGENSDAAIYVVDTNGGVPVKLVDGGGAVYSPDGSRIAYVRHYQLVNRNETRVVGADGSIDHVVGDRSDVQFQGSAAWSPDGTQLLMFRNSRTSGQVLAVAPADGSSPGQEFRVDFNGGFGRLGWSPDGLQIVSTSADGDLATLVNLVDGRERLVPIWYVSSWQRLAP